MTDSQGLPVQRNSGTTHLKGFLSSLTASNFGPLWVHVGLLLRTGESSPTWRRLVNLKLRFLFKQLKDVIRVLRR